MYVDDILGYGTTFEEHLDILRKIFEKPRENGVKLNPVKCEMFENSVKYLGRIISSVGYCNDPATTEILEKLSFAPKTVGDLPKLLGFLGYYGSEHLAVS